MNRHTISPTWCAVLCLIACGDEAVHPTPEPPQAAKHATATGEVVANEKVSKDLPSESARELATTEAPGSAEAPALAESSEAVLPEPVDSADVAKALGAGEMPSARLDASSSAQGLSAGEAIGVSAMAPAPTAHDARNEGPLRVITGFDEPVAVIHDSVDDVYLVSNLNRRGPESPGKGYIARVMPSGEFDRARFIDGAHKRSKLVSPRGMAIISGRLYVADGAVVRVYDRESGVRRGVITVPGASQLSGLGLGPAGSLYAADTGYDAAGRSTGSDAVYRINRAGRSSAIFRSPVLGHPSAVLHVDRTTWIGTLGSGKLYGVKKSGRLLSGPSLHDGGLTGLISLGKDDLVVTSKVAQGVYRGSMRQGFNYLEGGIDTPGHPGWDASRRRLLVPSQGQGEVRVVPLPKSKGPRETQG